MDEQILLDKIKKGDGKASEQLYMLYRGVFLQWAQKKYRVDSEQAKDIYQETFISLYENLVQGKFIKKDIALKTYFFAIGKNKIREHLRIEQRTDSSDSILELSENPIEPVLIDRQEIITEELKNNVNKLGDPCREILIKYYYQRIGMQAISELMGYKNLESAKNQKYKCLQRLRKLFNTDIKNTKYD